MRRILKLSMFCLVAGAVSACKPDEVITTENIPTAGVRFIHAVPDTMNLDFRFIDLVESNAHFRIPFRNNVVTHGEYGVKGSGLASGEPTLRAVMPDARVEGNVFIGSDVAGYPGGNQTARSVNDVGFVDAARGDWRLASNSRYKGAAGGRDPGADLDRVARATGLGDQLVREPAKAR